MRYPTDFLNATTLKHEDAQEYVSIWNTGNKNGEAVPASSTEIPTEVQHVFDGYLNGLIGAVNQSDFSLVEPFLLEGSPLYNDQVGLVDRLGEKGITQELVDYEIKDVYGEGGDVYIETFERIRINYSDGTSEVNDYNWVYSGTNTNGKFVLTKIERK
jgi:hypothetical protein